MNNLTNKEEQYIDNILSNGLEEIKDMNLLKSNQSNQIYNRNINKEGYSLVNEINTINSNRKFDISLKGRTISNLDNRETIKVKSNALKNLINQLKHNNDYIHHDNDNEQITLGNTNTNHSQLNPTNYKKQISKNREFTHIDIDKIDKNTKNFFEMKNEMQNIQNKITKLNSKITKNFSNNKCTNNSKGKSSFLKRSKSKKNINSSSFDFNYSFGISKKSYINYSPQSKNDFSSYQYKYKELKEKVNLQKEKIKAEQESINSLEVKIKQITQKNVNYNKLVEYNKMLFNQEEIIKKQITESENIRKEQSKLIRSLKKEIDILRIQLDPNSNNFEDISFTDCRQIKESFLKSQSSNNQSQLG